MCGMRVVSYKIYVKGGVPHVYGSTSLEIIILIRRSFTAVGKNRITSTIVFGDVHGKLIEFGNNRVERSE